MNLVDYEKYYHSGSEFIIPRDEFEKIIEENQRLNDDIKILVKENETKEKVIIKYDNVLNELEKELFISYKELFKDELVNGRVVIQNILNYLKELKESDK